MKLPTNVLALKEKKRSEIIEKNQEGESTGTNWTEERKSQGWRKTTNKKGNESA